MSELVNACNKSTNFRWQLLATVSAIALIGAAHGIDRASAADGDADHPPVWIELGGQLSRLDESQVAFSPPVSAARPSMFSPSQKLERLPLYSIDETGKISFEPDGSNWIFSASVRYGRSTGKKDVSQRTYPESNRPHYTFLGEYRIFSQPAAAARFAETNAQNGESHAVLDFQAGKDVGLGMFGGRDGSSVLNLGVRFAQFSTNSNIAVKSDPDFTRHYKYANIPRAHVTNEKVVTAQPYHSNAAAIRAARSFHGIGPSISWNASTPFAGNAKDGEFLFDLGATAALLFGRQKATIHHQSTSEYQTGHGHRFYHFRPYYPRVTLFQHSTNPPPRAHRVTVPNIGGFAGLSFRIANAKISAGYRADLFFHAMDGGIDTRKSENVGFYGPFASVSIGLGG